MRLINALETGDKMELNLVLRDYKSPNGAPLYPELLKIPLSDRIPLLTAAGGYKRVFVMLSAGIQMALEGLNLSKPLSSDQILDLVDTIIDSANEDQLSLEDVILFLQRLVRGETGSLFSSLDIQKFMQAFEDYRQERHVTLLHIREEQSAQHRVSGKSTRTTAEGDLPPSDFLDLLNTVYGKDDG